MTRWKGAEEHPFDEELAALYVGKYIIVGLTTLDHAGELIQQEQFHGVIESASPDGIQIALRGVRAGETWNMPPVLSAIRLADPGVYKLRSTGEEITNPDLQSTWILTKPPTH